MPSDAQTSDMTLELGRSLCGELATAERREWLVTNGLGGFACGTVAGTLTRRYHGLLVAALEPPDARTLLVTKYEEVATYAGVAHELATNRWRDGAIAPHGNAFIERFFLDGTIPVWEFALGDALLEKRIWMERGANATYVQYTNLRGASSIAVSLRALVNYRDFHTTTRAAAWQMNVAPIARGVRVEAHAGARPFAIVSDRGSCTPLHEWYRDFRLVEETQRGLDDLDDHLCTARFEALLEPGESFALLSTDATSQALDADGSLRRLREREAGLLGAFERARGEAIPAPPWLRRCVLAADQFIVARPVCGDSGALGTIAGYPWFGEWSRDTLISLKGLTLATGRSDVARNILRRFSTHVDAGMLPNYFPGGGAAPAYNAVDAPLWFIEAAAAYAAATGDGDTLLRLFPTFEAIVRAYREGTRYGIHCDPADGLIYAGEAGMQLTWMDAKVDDWVVTPRIGKPVEIAALWYNALRRLAALASQAGRDGSGYASLAAAAAKGFERFWNAERGYCYDVLDGPGGDDASLRPNQLFALSLPHSPLTRGRGRSIVTACAQHLFASTGLRSLAAGEPDYAGHYGGPQRERDGAYHQGTSWLWLLGVFVTAHARAFGDAAASRRFLDAYRDALESQALGTLGEIADGDPPFTPRGAFAQAWSVGEALRAWCDAPVFAQRLPVEPTATSHGP